MVILILRKLTIKVIVFFVFKILLFFQIWKIKLNLFLDKKLKEKEIYFRSKIEDISIIHTLFK